MSFRYSPRATGSQRWRGLTSTCRDTGLPACRAALETESGSTSPDLPVPARPAFLDEVRVLQTLAWAVALLVMLTACAAVASIVRNIHEATSAPVLQEPLGDLFYGPLP
jgi:hypothetical protein